jgi:AbrB family looped-hinge helix DNA binding protein
MAVPLLVASGNAESACQLRCLVALSELKPIRFRNGKEAMQEQEEHVYHTKIDSSGRIVIPVEARERRKLEEGDTILLVEDKHGLHVKTLDQALADVQAYYATLAPRERVLSDEINEDRRSEAERD